MEEDLELTPEQEEELFAGLRAKSEYRKQHWRKIERERIIAYQKNLDALNLESRRKALGLREMEEDLQLTPEQEEDLWLFKRKKKPIQYETTCRTENLNIHGTQTRTTCTRKPKFI